MGAHLAKRFKVLPSALLNSERIVEAGEKVKAIAPSTPITTKRAVERRLAHQTL